MTSTFRRAAAVAALCTIPFGGAASADGPVEDAQAAVAALRDGAGEFAREYVRPAVDAVREAAEQDPPTPGELVYPYREELRAIADRVEEIRGIADDPPTTAELVPDDVADAVRCLYYGC